MNLEIQQLAFSYMDVKSCHAQIQKLDHYVAFETYNLRSNNDSNQEHFGLGLVRMLKLLSLLYTSIWIDCHVYEGIVGSLQERPVLFQVTMRVYLLLILHNF